MWVFAGAAKRLTQWLCKRHWASGLLVHATFWVCSRGEPAGGAGSGGGPGLQAYSEGCQAHIYFRFRMFCSQLWSC